METRELTCIGCPLGCALTVTMNGKEVVEVKGNTCKKGDIYARKEVTNPTRIVTTIQAPVAIGDVVLENVAGTGVNIVAAGAVEAA